MTRNLLVTVDDHLRAFRRHRRQSDLAARHQTIASEHEVGCTQVQLHRSDVVFRAAKRIWLVTAPPFCAMPN